MIEGDKTKVIADEQNTPGLMEFSVNHEIKESKAFLNYVGPKIPKEEWQKILSFFKWTYDTWKSESQVRLFVNLEEETWMAWAFPQEADTGMSARELDNDAAKEQRAKIGPEWLYFGTVHHHCSCSAFQSGTDRSNEEDQDGIHITVGKMDEKLHDIHCRFYRKKWKLESNLDMSVFWDVSETLSLIPAFAKRFVPTDFANKIAREQMCEPSSVPFPEEWKSNVITKPRPVVTTSPTLPYVYGGSSNGGRVHSYGWSGSYEPIAKRALSAWQDIVDECADNRVDKKALEKAIDKLLNDKSPVGIVAGALARHKLSIEELKQEMLQMNKPVSIPASKNIGPGEDDMEKAWQEYQQGNEYDHLT